MKKPLWLLICVFLIEIATSQSLKTCSKNKKSKQTLNNINKCQITQTDNKDDTDKNISRELVVRFNNRYFVKRKKDVVKALDELNGNGVNNEKTSGITNEVIDVSKIEETVYQLHDVDYTPLFDTCKDVSAEQQLRCFNIGIGTYIQENFEYPEEALEEGITGKVTINFVIDKSGKIIKINANNDTNSKNILTEYSEQLISKLPVVKPALKKNKQVSISYELQLDFSLD